MTEWTKEEDEAITTIKDALEAKDERLELIGHADLAINNIYIFNGYGEDVPEGRTPIYAGYKVALEAKDEPVQNQLMALIDENQRLRAELKFNTTPPQRKPLTDEEIERIYNRYGGEMINCARAIERAHGIKGEA